jgi:hypothetical protein
VDCFLISGETLSSYPSIMVHAFGFVSKKFLPSPRSQSVYQFLYTQTHMPIGIFTGIVLNL